MSDSSCKYHYAPGVSDTVNPDTFSSVTGLWSEAVSYFTGRPAFTCMGHALSFSETDRMSTNFAAYLRHELGLQPGERVAVQLPNILQMPVVVYGILKAGLVLVNTNPLYTVREMREQFEDAGIRALIFTRMAGANIEQLTKQLDIEHLIVTGIEDLLPRPKRWLAGLVIRYIKKLVKPFHLPRATTFRKALAAGARHTFCPPAIRATDLALLQYTGGTTGKANGAMLTHRNLIANVLQAKTCLLQKDENGRRLLTFAGETIISPLPLYHIYAFTVHLMVIPCIGANNVLIPDPRDTNRFIQTLKKIKFSGISGINTLFNSLLNHPEFAQCDFSQLQMTLSGGTALSSDVATRWRQATGCLIAEGYGLTECSPVVSLNPFTEKLQREGTVGLPMPGTEVKVISCETGRELPCGEAGELCVRGPQVMNGYWHNSEATVEVMDSSGWLHTGDVATLDKEGFVTIVDRIKDVILVSGFNVYPCEIENVVASHPQVINCAATGVPDQRTGEAVKLFVVSNSARLTQKELRDYCRASLAPYKIPAHIEFRKELPLSPVGKVLRRVLREEDRQKFVVNG